MIFNKEICFLHVPKMAGMSVTRYLLNNLHGEIHLVVPENAFEHARRSVEYEDVFSRLHLHAGLRHENMAQAVELLSSIGYALDGFRKVLAVIRNPYTLERSYFLHLRKSFTRNLRLRDGKEPRIDLQLAAAGDFGAFCSAAPFYGKLPSRIERFYTLDGRTQPENFRMLRFESLEKDLLGEVEGFSLARSALGHHNTSPTREPAAREVSMDFDGHSEEAVYRKYAYLFKFYERKPDGVLGGQVR